MAFLLKKIVGSLLMPLPLFFGACVIALIVYKIGKKTAAKAIAVLATVSLYLLSIQPIAMSIASPLEFFHPRYENQAVDYVIVLGGSHKSDDRRPITSLLSETSLNRLMEGLRILNLNPGAKLLLSGDAGKDPISKAEAMALVAESLGIPRTSIILYPNARDTDDEARYWANYTDDKPVALVTSATHIPRAIKLFDRHGKHPIPAPTGYKTGDFNVNWRSFVPSTHYLDLVAKAWHEYLGIAWASLRS